MESVDAAERESILLWGWDKRLWRHMRERDLLPLARAIRTRLLGRAILEPKRRGLYESAARGWKLIAERLAGKHQQAA